MEAIMGRKVAVDDKTLSLAMGMCARSGTAAGLREAMCVVLPDWFGAGLGETARILGIGKSTVSRHRQNLALAAAGKAEGKAVLTKKSWGGRRRGNLSVARESQFMLSWERKARSQPLRSLAELHADYCVLIDKDVLKSTVHRLVARRGWRKQKGGGGKPGKSNQN